MDNITMTTEETTVEQPPRMELTSVEIKDENTALNIMVSFLNVAQKRGAFTINESAKIWECIQKFINASTPQSSQPV